MSNPDENVFIIRGGQGASKTVSIVELIIQALLSSEKEASILSSELSKMKRTVIRDYKKICKDWGIFRDGEFNKTESKHEYPNGSYLDFLGADVSDIGKGFRRDILYINEADKLDIQTAVEFISRCDLTIIDYNPEYAFWGDDYVNDRNILTLTYEDNEFLSQSEVKSILEYKDRGFFNPDIIGESLFDESNIKHTYWANRWRVFGLGLPGKLEGVVFPNWDFIDSVPDNARLLCTGVDFGYSVSKFAAVNIWQLDGQLILDELVYDNKLDNPEAAAAMKSAGYVSSTAYCDYSEPKSIAELKKHGIKAVPCESKRDVKNYAIKKLNERTFLVTKKSVNLANELRYLVWDERTGKPAKSNQDHLTDATMYAVGSMDVLPRKYFAV